MLMRNLVFRIILLNKTLSSTRCTFSDATLLQGIIFFLKLFSKELLIKIKLRVRIKNDQK